MSDTVEEKELSSEPVIEPAIRENPVLNQEVRRRSKGVQGTSKQKRALAILAKNGGNVGAAMRKAGYSKSMAHNPSKLTKSKAYGILIEKFLPDAHLLDRHREFLDAPRISRTFMKGALMNETIETDPMAVKALDMAYKLKGKYAADGTTTNVLIVQLSDTSAARYKPV